MAAAGTYFGGKNGNGTYQQIINKIPPHNRYIELFLGSGAILKHKRPAKENYGVEINSGTIDKFKYNAAAVIYKADVFEWVKEHWDLIDKNTFVYLDPPYPLGSRKSDKLVYDYEMTDLQHIELLELIKSMPAMVAISTYKNDLYHQALKSWNCYTFQSMTRRGLATEYLYMNYEDPKYLHDYKFLGKDFTDRQRIKRLLERRSKKGQFLIDLELTPEEKALNAKLGTM
jgi:DNA adenine methylase